MNKLTELLLGGGGVIRVEVEVNKSMEAMMEIEGCG